MKRSTFYALNSLAFFVAGIWHPWCLISSGFFAGVFFEIVIPTF